MNTTQPDYGLDAPNVVRLFLFGGTLLFVMGLVLVLFTTGWPTALGSIAFSIGVVFALQALLIVWSSRFGKIRARDRLLDRLELMGHETVLDLGCGRGLLLIGAAERLPGGRAVGLDLWSQEDLSDNRASATLANAAAKGVKDRVEARSISNC